MENKGLHQNRFKDNPLEKMFAEQWEEFCKNNSTINYLLSENNNEPLDEVDERDRVVAATVIQWLGSPCGSHFYKTVMGIV